MVTDRWLRVTRYDRMLVNPPPGQSNPITHSSPFYSDKRRDRLSAVNILQRQRRLEESHPILPNISCS